MEEINKFMYRNKRTLKKKPKKNEIYEVYVKISK